MRIRLITVLFTVLLSMVTFTNCMAKSNNVEEIKEWSGAMTESLLLAMNSDAYPEFSKNFSDKMKAAITSEGYTKQIVPIKNKIGEYIAGSKEYIGYSINNQNLAVNYKAKFTAESDDVLVTVVFAENNGIKTISGFWLNSPKLRA